MNIVRSLLICIGLVLFVGGCKTDCDKLWAHATELRTQAGDSDATARANDDKSRSDFNKQCEASKPSQISCALAATNHQGMATCFAPTN